MPIKRPQLVNREYYHIVVRGVGDTVIFHDINDYYRGIFSLYEFNTTKGVTIREQRKSRMRAKILEKQSIRGLTSDASDTRERLVDVVCFCFMPNHIHLLLRQLKNGSITQFMQKLGTGYASYFNKKYNRKGHLFQNRFHAVHIKDDSQLQTVFVYIHANPISLIEPGWKEHGIQESQKVIEFLESYKWSSHQDYTGKKNFPSVTERNFLLKIIGGEEGCRNFLNGWVEYKKQLLGWDTVGIE